MKRSPNFPIAPNASLPDDVPGVCNNYQFAPHDPAAFVILCLRDAAGTPMTSAAAVHRRLQQFLTDHPRALVELPRDHGKSTQVCARVVWELGRNPSLRVKIVCATDEVAVERSRFIRKLITGGDYLRMIFPHLVPARPWSAEAFSVVRPAEVIGPS